MIAISIILIIISIILICFSIYSIKNTHKENILIDELNNKKEQKSRELEKQIKDLDITLQSLSFMRYQQENEIDKKQQELNSYTEQINKAQQNITNTINNQESLSKKAFENYCDILDKDYNDKEKEYFDALNILNENYSTERQKLLEQLEQIQADLNQIKETRDAAMKAQLKEKEIKEKRSFYCLIIKDADLDDIKVLNRMKNQLHNSRILNMLIWSTYFQKPMTALCNNVIGTGIHCGIYKVTNQLDDMCYIGKSVDLARRWKEHAKCGLGIDTPQNNKLYDAMIRDGLWNFSFEVLEECSKEELDTKERYYIQLYQSYEYGYNSNQGIK